MNRWEIRVKGPARNFFSKGKRHRGRRILLFTKPPGARHVRANERKGIEHLPETQLREGSREKGKGVEGVARARL